MTLQAGCRSCHTTDSGKALKTHAEIDNDNVVKTIELFKPTDILGLRLANN